MVPLGSPTGKALPVSGIVAFYDHYWNPKWCSLLLAHSRVDITNTPEGSTNAYKNGQYAIVNLSVAPFKNFWAVAELQYGKRDNFSDGFSSNATKIQFSFKYSFSQIFYQKKDNEMVAKSKGEGDQ